MARSRTVMIGFGLAGMLIGGWRVLAMAADVLPSNRPPSITLVAASGATIEFRTQNGQTIGDIPPVVTRIPHLVLLHNGELTPPDQRTLSIQVSHLVVPTGGLTVTAHIETQHADPDTLEGQATRIDVWQMTQRLEHVGTRPKHAASVVSDVVFGPEITIDDAISTTPTDYYRIIVVVTGADDATPRVLISLDYAFLMEAQATVPLPDILETSAGAAPDALTIHFCDMVPFRHTGPAGPQQLARADVTAYVQDRLAPGMVQAVQVETDSWGFPWHDTWSSPFPGAGKDIGVALVDGESWFHVQAPKGAHAGIALNVSLDLNGTAYEDLTSRLIGCFYHELFHNLQRNLALYHGGHGDVAGAKGMWHFFYEGTAAAVESIGTPEAESGAPMGHGHFLYSANAYLGDADAPSMTNTSIGAAEPYAAALYWRFLFEKCGGMTVVREALGRLYTGEVTDIRTSNDVVSVTPQILDAALAAAGCPFVTFEASRQAFAEAVYRLRLADGRYGGSAQPDCSGLVDPYRRYGLPPIAAITYDGAPLSYSPAMQPAPTGIPSSFGIDLVEISIGQSADGRPLSITLAGAPGGEAAFSVTVLPVSVDGPEAAAAGDPQSMNATSDGSLRYRLPVLDWRTVQRLALIIVRTDALEVSDPVGAYTVRLQGE